MRGEIDEECGLLDYSSNGEEDYLLHYGSDGDIEDDGGSDYDHEENDEREIGSHLEEEDETEGSHGLQDYVIVSEAEVRARLEQEVSSICSVLSVPGAWACALLVHHNWNVGKLQDAWFTNEEAVRNAVGLSEEENSSAVVPRGKVLKCRICLEECLCSQMSAAACGHLFCGECWERYVHTAISDGPGCLLLRCPDPACCVIISKDMVERLATVEDGERYSRHLLGSYVGSNKKLRWCPAPDCQFAAELSCREIYDVRCRCSCYFCWNCGEEAHRPVDCDMVADWVLKNSSEAENTQWILAYCKPCPKCDRQIEKNEGCMHMTCRAPCRHEFCWLCLGDWSQHGTETGGYYECNIYQKAKEEAGDVDEEELKRTKAKQVLERYTHYYERWAANHVSRQKALEVLVRLETQVELWKDKYSQPLAQLEFIQEAWLQIAECRRVLKWSYAYGYYLPEEENTKRRFFEYLQGEAEAQLDILHSCAEKEVHVFLDGTAPSLKEFLDYRSKLVGLTSVVQRYFENLASSLVSGLNC